MNEEFTNEITKKDNDYNLSQLIELIKNENKDIRKFAIKSLRKIDQNWYEKEEAKLAVSYFISNLRHEDSKIRDCAAWALGELRDVRAIDPLGELLSDSDRSIRLTAVKALGKIKHERALKFLLEVLKDDDYELTESAFKSLENINTNWFLIEEANNIISEFISLLKEENILKKRKAIYILGKIKDKRALYPLIEVLEDKDNDVKKEALRALGEIGDHKAIERILKNLIDTDSNVRKAAAEALHRINPKWHETEEAKKTVHTFILALKDSNINKKTAAAWALLKLKEGKLIGEILNSIKHEQDFVKKSIIKILDNVNFKLTEETKRAIDIDIITTFLYDEDVNFRRIVISVLRKIGDDRAVNFLLKVINDRNVRKLAIKALNEINPMWRYMEESKKLAEKFLYDLKSEDWETREGAAWALGELKDPRAIEPLVFMLKDENSYVSEAAASALIKIKDSKAISHLIKLLSSESWKLRSTSKRILDNIDSRWFEQEEAKKEVTNLIFILKDSVLERKKAAAWALGQIRDKRAIELLIYELKDTNAEFREVVIKALINLIDIRVIEPLIDLFNDYNWYVREAVIRILENLQDKRVIQVLINAIQDEDWRVRRSAVRALQKVDTQRFIKLIDNIMRDKNWQVREAAIDALKDIKDEKIITVLINALKDEHCIVRAASARALGQIKDKRAIESLIDSLEDEYCNVREAAVKALGNMNNDNVIKYLIQALKDEDWKVRDQAIMYLNWKYSKWIERDEAKEAISKFISELKDVDRNVRLAACRALGTIGDTKFKEILTNILDDEDWQVRVAAELAIRRMKKFLFKF